MSASKLSWLERHFEKLALAGAGSVLLAVVVLAGISSPNTVSVEGETLDPRGFFGLLKQRAEEARLAAKTTGPLELPDIPGLGLAQARLPREPLPLFAPPNPRVPSVADLNDLYGLKVATILAPTKPVTTSGRAEARIPPPRQVLVGSTDRNANESRYIFTQDWHWVTLAGVISRKAQKQVFLKARYSPGRQELLVADVEAQRQERKGDGDWGPPEIIKPYLPVRFAGPREVKVHQGSTGSWVSPRNWDYIQAYRRQLDSREAQAGILRAPFQACLTGQRIEDDDRAAWVVPATLKAGDGTKVDLTDMAYGLCFLPDESVLASRRSPVRATAVVRWQEAREVLAKGWEEVGFNAYFDAVQALQSIARDANASVGLSKAAGRVLDKYAAEIEYAAHARRAAESRREKEMNIGLGPAFEPIWVTDTTVQPGKTYRYRLRLLALNPYAGLPRYLADPRDAGKIIIEGEWSAWSGAITVKPTHYLFLMGAGDEARKTVRVQLYQWSRGDWESGSATVGVGDHMVIKKGFATLTYDGVVRSIDFHRSYREPGDREKGAGSVKTFQSVALTLIKSDGTLEEHLAALDKALRTAVTREIREEVKRRKAVKEFNLSSFARVQMDGGGRPPALSARLREGKE
jgi:hypothetical protein